MKKRVYQNKKRLSKSNAILRGCVKMKANFYFDTPSKKASLVKRPSILA